MFHFAPSSAHLFHAFVDEFGKMYVDRFVASLKTGLHEAALTESAWQARMHSTRSLQLWFCDLKTKIIKSEITMVPARIPIHAGRCFR